LVSTVAWFVVSAALAWELEAALSGWWEVEKTRTNLMAIRRRRIRR
jgi:hypothetical protein